DREPDAARRGEEVGAAADPPAVEPVGDRAGDEHEQQRRRELGEAEQPEVELAAGEVEDLLAERNAEAGARGGRAEVRREHRDDRPARARVQRRERVVPWWVAVHRRDTTSRPAGVSGAFRPDPSTDGELQTPAAYGGPVPDAPETVDPDAAGPR